MPSPAKPLAFDPDVYLRPAFEALNWQGLAFEAAMQDPARRDIITFIATRWPQRPMENIVSVSRIDWLATDAATRCRTAHEANPYPEHSAAGQLFAKCFDAAQKRLSAQVPRVCAATESVVL